jgi:hypothetical protein
MTTAPTPPLLDLAPSRRAGSIECRRFVSGLRCECGQLSCRETFPAAAGSHRGNAGRVIVVPAHLGAIVSLTDLDNGTVVRAADRFFVVELNESAGRFPVAAEPRMRLLDDNSG